MSMTLTAPTEGRRRVVVEHVEPLLDGGRFAIKRVAGDRLVVSADVFADGHEVVCCRLLYRLLGGAAWREVPMTFLGNDRWQASFETAEVGDYEYTIEGWVDGFKTWQEDLAKRVAAGQDVSVDLVIGANWLRAAAQRAGEDDGRLLRQRADELISSAPPQDRSRAALSGELADLAQRYPDRSHSTVFEPTLRVVVDRRRALFGAWYELFPRSCATAPGKHGTLADCAARIPYVASMGFDVLYLPPIHPIGTTFRKGKNNAPAAQPGEPGSPWAIGGVEGGHKAIHPELGTLDDFRRLLSEANRHGMEVALDVAFQCSPDHPYVKEHPSWFRRRPDGTIQYAENPPKKYQDIFPFDFESPDWRSLWDEITSVVLYWAEQGVRIFRVDNPHTKPFAMWEELIGRVKSRFPDVVFLAEAFTRPKIMYRLAKLGFSQSYTYFTWRNGKSEFIDYFTELYQSEAREYFRPNLWPNTPDILPEHLWRHGRRAAMARLVLAATLSASYGVYGPLFELGENTPREPGSEEYLNSEKYEIRCWNLDAAESLRPFIARVNAARRNNPALQTNHQLHFHSVESDHLLCYSKRSLDPANLVLAVVNLDFTQTRGGCLELPLEEWGFSADRPLLLQDLLTDKEYHWHGASNYVELDPSRIPAHLFHVSQPGHYY